MGIRGNESKIAELKEHDEHGLLKATTAPTDLDDLLAEDPDLLGETPDIFDVSSLPARKSPADEGDRATRVKAKDFAAFEALFADKHQGLKEGTWKLGSFVGESSIRAGRFFLINGMMCFVAEIREPKAERGESKPRLRVVFENGTESSMYRSL